MIKGDSVEYDLIKKHIKNLEMKGCVLTCEIGLRRGLGSKLVMDAVREHKPVLYKHVAIDPYGNLKYKHHDGSTHERKNYDNNMMTETVPLLYKDYPEFAFFNMTDDYYFRTMGEGQQFIFDGQLMLYGLYKVVVFDGPHTTHDVLNEINFFIPRTEEEALFIFDDYPSFKLGIVDSLLKTYNFKVVEKGNNKIIYKKGESDVSSNNRTSSESGENLDRGQTAESQT